MYLAEDEIFLEAMAVVEEEDAAIVEDEDVAEAIIVADEELS